MRSFVYLELIGYEGEEVGGREREWSFFFFFFENPNSVALYKALGKSANTK